MSSGTMKVISNDEQEFTIDYDIVKQSKMLKLWFDDDIDEPIRLSLVDAATMKSIIAFCNHHKNDPELESSDDDDDDDDNTDKDIHGLKQRNTVSEWDRKFVQQFKVHGGTLFDIITAANYLDIKILLKTLCKSVMYMIRGKSSDEIREIFEIVELLDETATNNAVTSQTDTKNK